MKKKLRVNKIHSNLDRKSKVFNKKEINLK